MPQQAGTSINDAKQRCKLNSPALLLHQPLSTHRSGCRCGSSYGGRQARVSTVTDDDLLRCAGMQHRAQRLQAHILQRIFCNTFTPLQVFLHTSCMLLTRASASTWQRCEGLLGTFAANEAAQMAACRTCTHPHRQVHDGGRIDEEEAVQARGVVPVQRQRYVLNRAHQLAELQQVPHTGQLAPIRKHCNANRILVTDIISLSGCQLLAVRTMSSTKVASRQADNPWVRLPAHPRCNVQLNSPEHALTGPHG